MAKKSEDVKSKERKELMIWRTVVVILVLLLLWLWLAYANHWWPFEQNPELGTAFSSEEQSKSAGTSTGSQGTSGSTGSTGSSGSNGSNGSNGTNGTNGGGGTSTSGSALLTFAATVDTGDTKEEISGQANGLNEKCTIMADSSTVGKQEVCVYTEGDKVVTVTYLDDHVVSASRSGF